MNCVTCCSDNYANTLKRLRMGKNSIMYVYVYISACLLCVSIIQLLRLSFSWGIGRASGRKLAAIVNEKLKLRLTVDALCYLLACS